MDDLPERIHVSPTHRPSSAHDLFVHEPPHERGTEYLHADHVDALLAEERRKALEEAAQWIENKWLGESPDDAAAAIRALSDAPSCECARRPNAPAREVTVWEDVRHQLAALFREAVITALRDYDVPDEIAKNDPDLSDAANVYADAALRALSQGGEG